MMNSETLHSSWRNEEHCGMANRRHDCGICWIGANRRACTALRSVLLHCAARIHWISSLAGRPWILDLVLFCWRGCL
ncbi:hypothetical protein I7I48_12215 [Histoplasma ohiense]|nr:hypothetical protein I7I48_12215 [Histoplasma ohiense (nom. inval.)]